MSDDGEWFERSLAVSCDPTLEAVSRIEELRRRGDVYGADPRDLVSSTMSVDWKMMAWSDALRRAVELAKAAESRRLDQKTAKPYKPQMHLKCKVCYKLFKSPRNANTCSKKCSQEYAIRKWPILKAMVA